ncbi:thermonuclease family protein [Candidatus Kaiserbacteria bacterium]|nr:thermonuclease family protein [Candidatus Kaiserbacteria bacterium]
MRYAITAFTITFVLLLGVLVVTSTVPNPDTSQKNEVSGFEKKGGDILPMASIQKALPTSAQTANTEDTIRTYRWYRVTKVIDGDTFVVAMDGKNVTVRLIGIDTPETVDPRKTVQCFGREASEKAREILSDRLVRLETDPSQGELDKYGRLLAYAFPENGTNVASYLIAEGYGHEYTYNLPYKYQMGFKAAEERARANKRGLWADDACATINDLRGRYSPPAGSIPTHALATYECSRNAYNCSDFSTQAEAQQAFESCGGSENDIHKLDSDRDGEVCEGLP